MREHMRHQGRARQFGRALIGGFVGWLVAFGRYQKRAILKTADCIVLTGAQWLAYSIRYGELYIPARWPRVAKFFYPKWESPSASMIWRAR